MRRWNTLKKVQKHIEIINDYRPVPQTHTRVACWMFSKTEQSVIQACVHFQQVIHVITTHITSSVQFTLMLSDNSTTHPVFMRVKRYVYLPTSTVILVYIHLVMLRL